jgi:DNA replication and repair protein RecF
MLTEIEVRDFRCFASARLELHPRMTVLVGRNAQGKTSLLEAACVLLRLQSPRTGSRSDLIRFDCSSLMIEGEWLGERLRCGMSATARRLALDGAVCTRSADYLQRSGLVVWMDHADMNLVRGGAEHRRRFLDFAASQIDADYLRALQGYNRALRSRNYVLKRDTVINWRQADAFARLMESFHQVLTKRRRVLLAAMQPRVDAVMSEFGRGLESVQVKYVPGCTMESLFDLLMGERAEEERTRTTFTGSHRDDFFIEINGRAAEAFASEGQQRSISIALKIAQAKALEEVRQSPPLLLIDDVFGELDPIRRRALLEGLPEGTQAVLTTTHLDWASQVSGSKAIYEVEGGKLVLDGLE